MSDLKAITAHLDFTHPLTMFRAASASLCVYTVCLHVCFPADVTIGNISNESTHTQELEGEALYVAVACHVSALYEQDKEASGARLSELPRGLSEAFTLGVLLPLEVTHTYELVQALVLQLLAAPTGITRADLKLILRQQLSALQSKAWVPAADIEVDGVLMALEPFLLASCDADGLLLFEHQSLRLAAFRRYDKMVT